MICIIIITLARLQRVERRKPSQVFIHLQGLGSSQLADHLVNEINQGLCYVNVFESALDLNSSGTCGIYGGMWWCGHKRIDAWHQDTRNICSG